MADVDLDEILDAVVASALLGLMWAGYRGVVRWMWRNRKDADKKIEKEVKSVAGELRRIQREVEESFNRDLRP